MEKIGKVIVGTVSPLGNLASRVSDFSNGQSHAVRFQRQVAILYSKRETEFIKARYKEQGPVDGELPVAILQLLT